MIVEDVLTDFTSKFCKLQLKFSDLLDCLEVVL